MPLMQHRVLVRWSSVRVDGRACAADYLRGVLCGWLLPRAVDRLRRDERLEVGEGMPTAGNLPAARVKRMLGATRWVGSVMEMV